MKRKRNKVKRQVSKRIEHNANGEYINGVKVNKVKVLSKRLDTGHR